MNTFCIIMMNNRSKYRVATENGPKFSEIVYDGTIEINMSKNAIKAMNR